MAYNDIFCLLSSSVCSFFCSFNWPQISEISFLGQVFLSQSDRARSSNKARISAFHHRVEKYTFPYGWWFTSVNLYCMARYFQRMKWGQKEHQDVKTNLKFWAPKLGSLRSNGDFGRFFPKAKDEDRSRKYQIRIANRTTLDKTISDYVHKFHILSFGYSFFCVCLFFCQFRDQLYEIRQRTLLVNSQRCFS